MNRKDYLSLNLETQGIKVKGMKFVYKNKKVIDDLKQIGFNIQMLKVEGGELPLPQLSIHVDEQASLEAYWATQAETMRYKMGLAEDEFKYWYETKYYQCYKFIHEHYDKKPTQREVEARIMNKFGEEFKVKKDKIRELEYKYRMLNNACYASIVTKGKMMQTLRNVIQGNTFKGNLIGVEGEQIGEVDPEKLIAKGG